MMGHHGHHLQRAASFADFGQHMNGGYSIQQQQQQQQQYGHRHSLSSGGAHEYHGHPHNQAPMHSHEQPQQHQPQQQHPGVHMLQRTASLPQHSYFVTEQNNPGVATMNTNPHAAAPIHPQYQHVPRQGVERLPLEIPYSSAPGMAGSIQSSPSSFSAASGRSPSTQDGFYTHAPTAQAATYALHAASPVEQQAPQMVAYQGQMAPQAQVMTQAPPPQAVQQAPPQSQPAPEQYQPPHAQPEEQHWYNGVAYQPPVEVATIGQIPTYGSAVYDPWPKMEYEDPSMQLPSARIENM
jgi:metal regulatory transcription factor 1